ncbi:MAG: type II toxin-antitoxin system RelE/ParE family toxin [Bacteroidota bacterium]
MKTQERDHLQHSQIEIANDNELFKKLTDEVWEFRTLYNRTFYRLLAFWDKTGDNHSLVIATNGFIKKSKKTPASEIGKAKEIRKIYFEQKTTDKR